MDATQLRVECNRVESTHGLISRSIICLINNNCRVSLISSLINIHILSSPSPIRFHETIIWGVGRYHSF